MSLTAQQPYNNVVRTAVEALAAVLGGTNSLHTNALDETLALPSEQAAEIALRTQQVIMEETGVVNVADPLGGSWYVEALTDRIEAEAEEIFDRILAMGGSTLTSADVDGLAAATRRRRGADDQGHPARHRGRLVHGRDRRGRLPVPDGAGEGREEGRRRQLPHRLGHRRPGDPAGLATRWSSSRCACWPSARPPGTTPRSAPRSPGCVEVARSDGNMIAPMLDAVRAEATLGEICDVLRAEWGEYREPARF